MKDVTKALRHRVKDDPRPSVTPMYLTSGFESGSTHFYTRKSNPNSAELEQAVAALEGAAHGLAVTTGMTAISIALDMLEPGETLCIGTRHLRVLVQAVPAHQREAPAHAARPRPHGGRTGLPRVDADGVPRNADQSVSEDRRHPPRLGRRTARESPRADRRRQHVGDAGVSTSAGTRRRPLASQRNEVPGRPRRRDGRPGADQSRRPGRRAPASAVFYRRDPRPAQRVAAAPQHPDAAAADARARARHRAHPGVPAETAEKSPESFRRTWMGGS